MLDAARCLGPPSRFYTTSNQTPSINMGSSFSKPKEKARDRQSRGGHGSNRREVGAQGVRVEPTNLHAEVEDGGKVDPPSGEPKSTQAVPTVLLKDADGPVNPNHTQALHHTSRQNVAGEPRNLHAEMEGGAKADPPSTTKPKNTKPKNMQPKNMQPKNTKPKNTQTILTALSGDADDPINPNHTQVLHHTSRENAAGEPRNPRAEVEGGAKADPPSLREPKST